MSCAILWLKRSSNCRIFQEMTVPDIVKQVCSTYGGVVALTASLSGDYPALPYCVQYRETDFDFVCRLLEEPELAERLALRARANCDAYRWAAVRDRWLSVYRSVLPRPGAVHAVTRA